MTSSYIRKFRPDKPHLISAVLLLIALILFISGAYRAFRMVGCADQSELFNESDVRKNRSLTFSAKPVSAELDGTENNNAIVFEQVSKGIMSDYEIMIVNIAGKYRYVAVEKDSEEHSRLMDGEEVTGYFSDKYSDDFLDYVSGMSKYYKEEYVIPLDECSEKGIIIIEQNNETMSFAWGIPFLLAGLLLLYKAGSPFFYMPEDTPDNKTENK